MHEPYRLSLAQWVPQCRLIYDKFHVMQHANEAVTEVRRAEFFRKGGAAGELIKGKHWLLLTRWVHLNTNKKRQLNKLNLEGILNYCKIKVPLGVVEAVKGNIKALLRRGRGHRDLDYLLLKAQRLAATIIKTEFVAFQKAAQNARLSRFSFRAQKRMLLLF
jgi:transposase